MKLRTSFTAIFEYFYIIFVILESNTVYSSAEQFTHISDILLIIALILFMLKIANGKIKKNKIKKYMSFLAIYATWILFFIIFSVSNSVLFGFVCKFLIFIPLSIGIFYLPNEGANNRFIKRFINVVVFLAITSVFFWLFGSVLKVFSPNMSIYGYWGRYIDFQGYYGLLFENQYNDVYNIYRNDGIFTEGPMYSVVLSFALCFEIYFNNHLDSKKELRSHRNRIMVIVITMITTLTTSAILVMALLFLYYLWNPSSKSKKQKALMVFFFIILACTIAYPIYSLVFEKMQSYSGVTRLGAITSSFIAWKNAPLFGNGYNSMNEITNISNSLYGRDTGSSNSVFIILAQGGIVFAVVYILPLVFSLLRGTKNQDKALQALSFLVIFEMIITWIPYKFFLLMIISFLYINVIERRKFVIHKVS